MKMQTLEYYAFSKNAIETYGLHYVLNNLKACGYNVRPYDATTKNPVLVSLYWQEQLYPFLKWRYSSNLKGREIIVGGNYPTSNPNIFKIFDCDVFMGDGELFKYGDPEFLAVEDGPKEKAVADLIKPFGYIETQKASRGLCELSRGCKNHCLFCQYSWLKPYREAGITDIKKVLSFLKKEKINQIRCFAADRLQHSEYNNINKAVDDMGLTDTSCDITLLNGLRGDFDAGNVNAIQFGLEGLSERLRKIVKKPISDKDFISFCKKVAGSGRKAIQAYMIYGLPTENDADVDAFRGLIERADKELPENFVLCFHWNAFQPNALTPFQWAAPAMIPNKQLRIFWREKINKRIKILHKPTITSEWTMVKRIIAIRADEKTKHIPFTISRIGNTRTKYTEEIKKEFLLKSGYSLCEEWPLDVPLPWDKYIKYDIEKLKKIYLKLK